LANFPKNDVKLKTKKGTAICQKTDIFKGLLWFAYEKEAMNWHELTLERVQEIIAINKKGNTVANLEDYKIETKVDHTELFSNVVGQDSLTRFDRPKTSQRRKKKKRNSRKPIAAASSKANHSNTRNKKRNNRNKPRNPRK
jgi:hypothetical protein